MFSICIKKDRRRCAKLFQSCQSPTLLIPNTGEAYLCEGVTATSIIVLSFVILFYICFYYKFRNVSVRKCLIVQLAKFFMLFIIISTNSLNEIKLSLRPIIRTATLQ